MKVIISTKKKMSYPTAGDYKIKNGILCVDVFEQGNEYKNILIAIHEIVEYYLAKKFGVTEKEITAFDLEYEKNRKRGDESEPGDDKNCPYRVFHRTAENIERLIASEMGIDFNDYNGKIKVYGESKFKR